ncbi:hypothetical protein L195_g045585, partial [Trifolium pratense]
MFTIKERKYKVEYEGLHLLCTTCGKFGHYKEGCPDKLKQPERRIEDGGGANDGVEPLTGGSRMLAGNNVEGPWVVVQKPKRTRKGKDRETPAVDQNSPASEGINGDPKLKGSRFASLSGEFNEFNDDVVTNMEENDIADGQHEQEKNQDDMMGGNNKGNHDVSSQLGQHNKVKTVNDKNSNEKAIKDGKLAARGSHSFKSKSNNSSKKGGDNLHARKVTQLLEDQMQNTNDNNKRADTWSSPSNYQEVQKENKERRNDDTNEMTQNESLALGQMTILSPNQPRPPDLFHTPLISNKQHQRYANGESDEFVDANEHGLEGNSDSDMEIVGDTPSAANTSFYRYCKHYVASYKPVMVVIMETRCDPNRLRRTFMLLGFDKFIATEVEGYSGGIVVAWKEDHLK